MDTIRPRVVNKKKAVGVSRTTAEKSGVSEGYINERRDARRTLGVHRSLRIVSPLLRNDYGNSISEEETKVKSSVHVDTYRILGGSETRVRAASHTFVSLSTDRLDIGAEIGRPQRHGQSGLAAHSTRRGLSCQADATTHLTTELQAEGALH